MTSLLVNLLTIVILGGTILGTGFRVLRKLEGLMDLPTKFDAMAKRIEDIEKRLDANVFTRRRR